MFKHIKGQIKKFFYTGKKVFKIDSLMKIFIYLTVLASSLNFMDALFEGRNKSISILFCTINFIIKE